MRHPEIDYFKNALLPDKDFFQCPRQPGGLSLSVDSCAAQWERTRYANNPCTNCPIGACHAGKPQQLEPNFKHTKICARCLKTANRLLNGAICPSCYNRELELLKGCNAKGGQPKRAKPLHSIGLSARTINTEHRVVLRATTPMEAVLSAMRTTNSVAFCFGQTPNIDEGQKS